MLGSKLRLTAAIAALVFVPHICVARETSFWSHIQAIESRDLSSSLSNHQDGHSSMLRRDQPPSADHSSSVKCTHPVARVSFYTLTSAEQSAWIENFKLLSTPGKSIFVKDGSFMDDLAMVHIGLQQEMHYNSCFLVCHTAFLRAFYTLMRVTGYRGREAYWDIEHDSKQGLQNAAIWHSFGTDDGKGGPIPNGPFRNLKCGVLPNMKKTGYSVIKPHYVTRQFNSDWDRKPMIRGDMYTSHFNAALYNDILSAPNYTILRRKLEVTVHSWIHQSIGGEMWLFSAVCEPAFWLLHAEIDRYWRSWQNKHNIWDDYQGHRKIRRDDGTTEFKVSSLDDIIDFYGMFEKVKVREVMHPRRGIMCYRYDHLLGGVADDSV